MLIQSDRSLAWSEVPDPAAKDGEALIEVHAAGLNRADLLQRAGRYPPPPGWPSWPGLEVSGVVLDAPPNGRWRAGDRVCALLGGGGYAERVAVPAALVLPLPAGLSLIEAAAVPEVFATAFLNLCLEGGLTAGQRVFIQAGASGVGMAAIQLAKELGASVVTSVGSEAKARFVRELGADVVIHRKRERIADALARYPVNVALDCVAGPDLGACLDTMAAGGRWIVIATLGGASSELDMPRFFMRGIRLIGSTLRSRPLALKAQVLAGLERTVWPALAAGRIKVAVHKVLPMAQAEAAQAILKRQENLGKVVLTVKP